MVGLGLTMGNWAFFYLNLVLANIAMASFFRIVALAAPDMEAAQTFPDRSSRCSSSSRDSSSPRTDGRASSSCTTSPSSHTALRLLCQNEFLSAAFGNLVAVNPIEQCGVLGANENDTAVTPVHATLCAARSTVHDDGQSHHGADPDRRRQAVCTGAARCSASGSFLLTFGGLRRAAPDRIVMNIRILRAGTDEEMESARQRDRGDDAVRERRRLQGRRSRPRGRRGSRAARGEVHANVNPRGEISSTP